MKRVLSAAGLRPQTVKLVVTTSKQGDPPGRVNYCAAEAVGQASATSLDVDRGRAIVMVFDSRGDAAKWTPAPECGTTPLRVGNVIAVATDGRLSPRLRTALRPLNRRD